MCLTGSFLLPITCSTSDDIQPLSYDKIYQIFQDYKFTSKRIWLIYFSMNKLSFLRCLQLLVSNKDKTSNI